MGPIQKDPDAGIGELKTAQVGSISLSPTREIARQQFENEGVSLYAVSAKPERLLRKEGEVRLPAHEFGVANLYRRKVKLENLRRRVARWDCRKH